MLRNVHPMTTVALLWALTLPATAPAADDVLAGQALFMEARCWVCHGEEGNGKGPVAPASPVEPRNFTANDFEFDADDDGKPGGDDDLLKLIQQGALAFGGSAIMLPNPGLTEEDIQAIIVFVRSLRQ
jgi:mono/diheme cytochrome c family protein